MDEELGKDGHVVQGLDVLEILRFMDKKKKRFLSIALNELEEIFDAAGISRDSPEFQYTRKLILDLVNEYTRSILTLIFGKIETERYEEKKEPEDK